MCSKCFEEHAPRVPTKLVLTTRGVPPFENPTSAAGQGMETKAQKRAMRNRPEQIVLGNFGFQSNFLLIYLKIIIFKKETFISVKNIDRCLAGYKVLRGHCCSVVLMCLNKPRPIHPTGA